MEQNEGTGEVRHLGVSDCDSTVISAIITSVNSSCSHFQLRNDSRSNESKIKGQGVEAGRRQRPCCDS